MDVPSADRHTCQTWPPTGRMASRRTPPVNIKYYTNCCAQPTAVDNVVQLLLISDRCTALPINPCVALLQRHASCRNTRSSFLHYSYKSLRARTLRTLVLHCMDVTREWARERSLTFLLTHNNYWQPNSKHSENKARCLLPFIRCTSHAAHYLLCDISGDCDYIYIHGKRKCLSINTSTQNCSSFHVINTHTERETDRQHLAVYAVSSASLIRFRSLSITKIWFWSLICGLRYCSFSYEII